MQLQTVVLSEYIVYTQPNFKLKHSLIDSASKFEQSYVKFNGFLSFFLSFTTFLYAFRYCVNDVDV